MSRVTSVIAASVFALTAALGSTAAFAGPRDTSLRACVAKAMPTNVTIKVKTMREKDGKEVEGTSIGSGSIVDSQGIVITNDHVISGAVSDDEGHPMIRVQLAGQDGKWRQAVVLYTDKATDLAALMIATTPKDGPLPEIELGPSSDLAVGEPAYVIGSPLGQAFSLSAGVISRTGVLRPEDDMTQLYLIQTDASVNPGNSGGELLNANCEQVGVVELKMGDAGLGFAITSDRTARWLAANLPAEKAGIYHGIRAVSLKVVAEDGPNRQQVFVKELAVDSPAASVLKLGDQIVTINGRSVGNQWDVERFLGAGNAGDEAKLQIVRDGKAMDVSFKLAEAPKVQPVKD